MKAPVRRPTGACGSCRDPREQTVSMNTRPGTQAELGLVVSAQLFDRPLIRQLRRLAFGQQSRRATSWSGVGRTSPCALERLSSSVPLNATPL
jgi:hypothetical protein